MAIDIKVPTLWSAAAAASRLAVTAQLTATMEASSCSAITPSTGTTAVLQDGDGEHDHAESRDEQTRPPDRGVDRSAGDAGAGLGHVRSVR